MKTLECEFFKIVPACWLCVITLHVDALETLQPWINKCCSTCFRLIHLRLLGSSPFTLALLPDDFPVFPLILLPSHVRLPTLLLAFFFLLLLPLICLPGPVMCFNTFIFAGFVLSQSSPLICRRNGSFWPVNHTTCFEVRNKGGRRMSGWGVLNGFGQRCSTLSLWHGGNGILAL